MVLRKQVLKRHAIIRKCGFLLRMVPVDNHRAAAGVDIANRLAAVFAKHEARQYLRRRSVHDRRMIGVEYTEIGSLSDPQAGYLASCRSSSAGYRSTIKPVRDRRVSNPCQHTPAPVQEALAVPEP